MTCTRMIFGAGQVNILGFSVGVMVVYHFSILAESRGICIYSEGKIVCHLLCQSVPECARVCHYRTGIVYGVTVKR